MAHLDVRVFIRATPEQVWKIIAGFRGQARWMVDVRRLAVTSEQREGAGTVVEVTSTVFGLPLVHDVLEVTVWEPPRRYEVLHRGQFTGRGRFLLEPVRGGTVFMWQEDFRPPLGVLGELGFSLVVGPHLRRVLGRSMANARRLAEGDAGLSLALTAGAPQRRPPAQALATLPQLSETQRLSPRAWCSPASLRMVVE
jgi:hypothetical protein